jgi:hypothetical protein
MDRMGAACPLSLGPRGSWGIREKEVLCDSQLTLFYPSENLQAERGWELGWTDPFRPTLGMMWSDGERQAGDRDP